MNLIQLPTMSLGNKGQKIHQVQKIHKKEKETTSIVATHLLTFHFTRNQYSPNIFAKNTKEQWFKGCSTWRFFLSLHQGIKQMLSSASLFILKNTFPRRAEIYLKEVCWGKIVDEQRIKKSIFNSVGRDVKAAVLPNIISSSVCLLSLTINILLCSPSISLQFKQGVANGMWSSRSLLESCL